jgi:hypothetical protein
MLGVFGTMAVGERLQATINGHRTLTVRESPYSALRVVTSGTGRATRMIVINPDRFASHSRTLHQFSPT